MIQLKPRKRVVLLAGLAGLAALAVPGVPAWAAVTFVSGTPAAGYSVDGTVYATLQVGGTVYLGGSFTAAVAPDGSTVTRHNLAAFDMDSGGLVTAFRADTGSTVRSLATDGHALYVGGNFARVGGAPRTDLAKVDLATGAVDPAFAATLDGTVRALATDGPNLVLGGTFSTVDGTSRPRLAKVDRSTGTLVGAFAPAVPNDAVYAVKVSPASRTLYVAGQFSGLGGTARNGLAAVNADTGGLTGPAFASSARPTFGIDITDDGSRVFASGGSATNATAAWDPATGVRKWHVVTDGDNQAIDYYGGMVYFGFHDGYQANSQIKLLAADAGTGAVDPGFRPTFDRFWGVWAISASARGLAVGGDFTSVGGLAAGGFARFLAAGTPPPPPPTTVTVLGGTSSWAYWDRGTTPAGWNGTGFADGSWPTGPPRLGYGDTFDTTTVGYGGVASAKYVTTYFRAHFGLSTVPDALNLLLSDDDGAVVYLNGTEVVRDNLPAGGISASTLALTDVTGGAETAMHAYSPSASLLHTGDNVVAVEVHQYSRSSSDIGLDMQLDAVYGGAA